MKIKLLALTKEDIANGFKFKEEYDVLKIEISGDESAYDIWYQVKSDQGKEIYVQDLMTEEVFVDKKISKIFNRFDKARIPYKFKFEIIL